MIFVAAMAVGMLASRLADLRLRVPADLDARCVSLTGARVIKPSFEKILFASSMAADAVLCRARFCAAGVARQGRHARLRSCDAVRRLGRGRGSARRARDRRSDALGVADRHRHPFRLHQLRFAHRHRSACGLAALDGRRRFRRTQAEVDGLDRRHFRRQAARGFHGRRPRNRTAISAGRRACSRRSSSPPFCSALADRIGHRHGGAR